MTDPRQRLRSKFRGALLGAAVGDALGAPYEGVPPAGDVTLTVLHENENLLPYTDDTLMTLGLAESLLERGGFDGPHMASTWIRDFVDDPERGYGASTIEALKLIASGVPIEDAAASLFDGEGSLGNGGAMRVAPAALFEHPDTEAVLRLARRTCAITHANVLAVEGAALQAAAISLLLPTEGPDSFDAGAFTLSLLGRLNSPVYSHQMAKVAMLLPRAEPAVAAEQIGNSTAAFQAVPAALFCFLQARGSFESVAIFAINLGGDTDTIASMACSMSGALLGEEAIPLRWRQQIEHGDRIRRLADSLWARLPA